MKAAAAKVMWVGRATVFFVGLAVILATVLGTAAAALAAVPGDPFRLGQPNAINRITELVGNTANPLLRIDNNGQGPALHLLSEPDRAPLAVNAAAGKATNLNADKVDGKEASALEDVRAYAHITGAGALDTSYPSKGVASDGVVKPEGAATNLYCFDLAFTPHLAVGSPYFTNSAVVATVTPPNSGLSVCPATHRDAAVRIFASNTGAPATDVNFQILFM